MEHSLADSTILITGGAGFIGSHLVEQLLTLHPQKIVIVDNLINGKHKNIAHMLSDRVRFCHTDIRNQDEMAGLLQSVHIVYHLASLNVRHSIYAPYENHQVNADATLKLLKLAHRACVKRFVHVSTSEVYGTATTVPMTEDHPTKPMTIYGASKLAGECYSRAFHRTYDFPSVIVRPFNAYGPRCHHEGDCGEVIPKFMLRCMAGKPMVIFGDGKQTRDFSYVDDIARGILLAGVKDEVVGRTINLGTGQETSLNALTREIAKVVGRTDPPVLYDEPRPGDVLRLCAEVSQALVLLGYTPSWSLHDGLRKLHKWYSGMNTSPEELLKQEIVHNWNPDMIREHMGPHQKGPPQRVAAPQQ